MKRQTFRLVCFIGGIAFVCTVLFMLLKHTGIPVCFSVEIRELEWLTSIFPKRITNYYTSGNPKNTRVISPSKSLVHGWYYSPNGKLASRVIDGYGVEMTFHDDGSPFVVNSISNGITQISITHDVKSNVRMIEVIEEITDRPQTVSDVFSVTKARSTVIKFDEHGNVIPRYPISPIK